MNQIDNIMALADGWADKCATLLYVPEDNPRRQALRAAIEQLQAENEALRTALRAVMALPAMNNSGDGAMEFYHAVRAADALARAGETK